MLYQTISSCLIGVLFINPCICIFYKKKREGGGGRERERERGRWGDGCFKCKCRTVIMHVKDVSQLNGHTPLLVPLSDVLYESQSCDEMSFISHSAPPSPSPPPCDKNALLSVTAPPPPVIKMPFYQSQLPIPPPHPGRPSDEMSFICPSPVTKCPSLVPVLWWTVLYQSQPPSQMNCPLSAPALDEMSFISPSSWWTVLYQPQPLMKCPLSAPAHPHPTPMKWPLSVPVQWWNVLYQSHDGMSFFSPSPVMSFISLSPMMGCPLSVPVSW